MSTTYLKTNTLRKDALVGLLAGPEILGPMVALLLPGGLLLLCHRIMNISSGYVNQAGQVWPFEAQILSSQLGTEKQGAGAGSRDEAICTAACQLTSAA